MVLSPWTVPVGGVPYGTTLLVYPSKGITFVSEIAGVARDWTDKSIPSVRRDTILYRNFYEPTTLAEVRKHVYDQTHPTGLVGRFVEWKDIPD